MTAKNFKDAYMILQQHAATLRNQQEPNIDELLTLVSESVEAYNLCKQRLDAVEQAMQASFKGIEVG